MSKPKRNLSQLETAVSSWSTEHVLLLISDDRMLQRGDLNRALLLATNLRKLEIVRELLEKGADVRERDEYQNSTALMIAVKNNYQDIVDELLQYGSEVNAKDKYNDTPLILAIENGCHIIARKLVAYGADVNVKNNKGETILLMAADEVETMGSLFRLFIDKGVDVNAVNPQHNSTALHKVICNIRTDVFDSNAIEAINVLLDEGCDTLIKTTEGTTALMIAMSNDFSRFSNPEIEPTDYNKYFREQMANTFNRFFSKCENLDDVDNNGESALMTAAEYGYLHHIKSLVSKGCSIHQISNKKWTALRYAVSFGHLDVVQFLLDEGADLDINDDKDSPLIEEALRLDDNKDMVELLLQYGCKIDFKFIQVKKFVRAIEATNMPLYFLEMMYLFGSSLQSEIVSCLKSPEMKYDCERYKAKASWLRRVCSYPRTLRSCCRTVIRRSLQKSKGLDKIDHLPLYSKLKRYLKHEQEEVEFDELNEQDSDSEPKAQASSQNTYQKPAISEERRKFWEWADANGIF